MISEELYQSFLKLLLTGDRHACGEIVLELLEKDIAIKDLYAKLFRRALYQVGELWECNEISVAKEHLATSITESLMSLVYPYLFAESKCGKKAVISCATNEFHQVGGKMVADVFELNGWDGHFLGANTDQDELMRFIQKEEPDIVGLSISLLANLDSLLAGIDAIKANFKDIDILVGGQAFRWGGIDKITRYNNVYYIHSLADLEQMIEVI